MKIFGEKKRKKIFNEGKKDCTQVTEA